MKHSVRDIRNGVDDVSSVPVGANMAWLDLETGHVSCVSDAGDSDEDTPDDMHSSARYLALPHQNELVSGRRLVQQFVLQHAPKLADRVADAFSRKGAWRRYKALLHDHDLLNDWHRFEERAIDSKLHE